MATLKERKINMKKILFQGDSITDALRQRWETSVYNGSGYATLVSAHLGYEYPNRFEFVNRGISGNRITDLISRIKCDFINLEPDYLSILIGINDVWHEISSKNGVSEEKFERYYNNFQIFLPIRRFYLKFHAKRH